MYKKLLFKLLEASEALDLNAAGVQISTESNIPCHLLTVTAKWSRVFNSSPVYNTTRAHSEYLDVPTLLCLYTYIFFFVALRPNTGHGLLILEDSRSHATTHYSR